MRCWLLATMIAAVAVSATAGEAPKAPLTLARAAELPDVTGDMDHLAIDAAGQRLFVAAEDNGTLRVIDLKTGRLQRTVKGFKTPHSILFLQEARELYITDGSNAVQVLDSDTFRVKRKVQTTPGADSIAVDRQKHLLYAVSGGKDASMARSAISEINFADGKLVREFPIEAAKVEAMALETSGNRLFVNVTEKNFLAVLDRETGKIVARWPIKEAEQNAPLAFDEDNHRLFVVCRKPGKLVVVDSTDGRTITSSPTGERADEVVFDTEHRRIYVPAGEGSVYVYQQIDRDHYAEPVKIPSAAGAKTALLSPDARKLFVAVSPGEGKTGAKVLMYDVN
jgi:DNA-binding beta-propeller fold protein YncE